jgi:hypothetical protein
MRENFMTHKSGIDGRMSLERESDGDLRGFK